MKEIRSYFGAALVAVRTSLGVSQYRIAQITGLSEKYLNLLEHGAYDPKASTILKISRAMQISAGVILDKQERIEADAQVRKEHATILGEEESPTAEDQKVRKQAAQPKKSRSVKKEKPTS